MSNLATAVDAARPARRDADAAERADEPEGAVPVRRRDRRGLRRHQGRAVAGDGARARRPGLGSPRHHLQHHRPRRGSQAARADPDPQHAQRNRLRTHRPVSGAVGVDRRAAASPTTTSRSCRRPTAMRSTASAARAERLAEAICRRSCRSGWRRLGQANVRALSVTTAARPASRSSGIRTRAGEMARDLSALAEDLLMSGAYDDAAHRDAGDAVPRRGAEGHRRATRAGAALDPARRIAGACARRRRCSPTWTRTAGRR